MKQKIKLYKIKGNKANPRIIKDAKFYKLVESLQNFPEMLEKRPIVVNEDMVVLGGNMRLKACKHAGLKEVWIDIAEGWTQEKQDEFTIKDNVNFGEWDWEALGNDWKEADLDDWGLDVWQTEEPEEKAPYEANPNFDDEGVSYQSQYGVIVHCQNEKEQEQVYKDLTDKGFKCKVVVT